MKRYIGCVSAHRPSSRRWLSTVDPMEKETIMAQPDTWGPVLNLSGGTNTAMKSATQLQDGRILVTWPTVTDAVSVQAMILNADGSVAKPAFKVNQREGDPGIPEPIVLKN